MTITEFLEARITEDEARASSGWARLRDSRWETTNEGQDFLTPSAVLAECAAKRAIVELHGNINADFQDDAAICQTCHDHHYHAPADWPCPTIRAIASVYVDHADYRQEWEL